MDLQFDWMGLTVSCDSGLGLHPWIALGPIRSGESASIGHDGCHVCVLHLPSSLSVPVFPQLVLGGFSVTRDVFRLMRLPMFPEAEYLVHLPLFGFVLLITEGIMLTRLLLFCSLS